MCLDSVLAPTQQSQGHATRLKIMSAAHLIFGILQLGSGFALSVFFQQGIVSLLTAYLVLSSATKLLAIPLVMVIFFSFYFAIDFSQYFLVPVQNGSNVSNYSSSKLFVFSVAVISCAFNIFCLIYYYYPYKCFRKLNPATFTSPNPTSQRIENQVRKQDPKFKPFQGKGVKIG